MLVVPLGPTGALVVVGGGQPTHFHKLISSGGILTGFARPGFSARRLDDGQIKKNSILGVRSSGFNPPPMTCSATKDASGVIGRGGGRFFRARGGTQ